MPPQTAKSLMKEFRASFRRKKVVDPTQKANALKEVEEEELAKLVELKENMGDLLPPLYTDAHLLGFIRAKFLNVKEAEKLVMIDENMKRLLNVNDYKPSEELSSYNFGGVIGFDKEGSVVRVLNLGGADTKGLMNRVSTITGFKTLIWMINHDMNLLEEEYRKTGRKNNQVVFVVNLDELTMHQFSYKPVFDTAVQALRLLQEHYHDVLKKVYFINAPPFFSSLFKLFKSAIQDSLQQKIKIYDHEASWKEEFLKNIDADVLPKYLGGNRVDSSGDPKCGEFISFGARVPESRYASNFLDPDDPDVTVATVAAGATLNFRFPVRKAGSTLRWHFQGKDNDIGIGVFREPFPSGSETPRKKKEGEGWEQLTPVIRCQCHLCPEEGSATLWFTGNVVVHFDNSYSWMNSKEVFFKIAVVPPTELNSALHKMAL